MRDQIKNLWQHFTGFVKKYGRKLLFVGLLLLAYHVISWNPSLRRALFTDFSEVLLPAAVVLVFIGLLAMLMRWEHDNTTWLSVLALVGYVFAMAVVVVLNWSSLLATVSLGRMLMLFGVLIGGLIVVFVLFAGICFDHFSLKASRAYLKEWQSRRNSDNADEPIADNVAPSSNGSARPVVPHPPLPAARPVSPVRSVSATS